MKTLFILAFVIWMLWIGTNLAETWIKVMQDSRTAYDLNLLTE